MKLKNILLFFLIVFCTTIYSQSECASIDGETISIDNFYKKGRHNFTPDIQASLNRVENYFKVDITFYLAKDYDGICHEFISSNKGKVTIGEDFIDRFKDDLIFFEVIIAHEIGHTIQHTYKNKYRGRVLKEYGKSILKKKYFEMQADVIAGYYLGHWLNKKLRYANSKKDRDKFYTMASNALQSIKHLSDLEFTNDKHHGDFSNRSGALNVGFYLYSGKVMGLFRLDMTNKINNFSDLYYYSFVLVEEKLKERGIIMD